MADAFDTLRLAVPAANPDPAFAARLRARIARALTLPRGVAVSTTMQSRTEPAQEHLGAAIPYLAVADARRALDWYAEIFGARVVGDPIVMPDGRIGHSELVLNGAKIYLADAHPEIGFVAPIPGQAAVLLMLRVHDADMVYAAAVAAGASSHREPGDDYGSRNASIVDPFGHRWGLNSPLATARTPGHGDVVYASPQVPDADRAAAFFGSVLGWTYEEDSGPHRGVRHAQPAQAIYGGEDRSSLFLCYGVDDIDAAVERVRAAGGTASAISDRPYGRIADCTDDQGTPFALNEVSGGDAARTDMRQGDVVYITHQVADSGRARAFYAAVLGWRFSPGHVEDGWQVENTAPMAGLAGGSDEPACMPMWQVDDIAAAVARVREAGGTATEPQQQPYGQMAECTDDQGFGFYLGQL